MTVKSLSVLDKVLESRTFLVGNTVTLADIILCCILAPGMKTVFDPAFRAPFPSLCRYFETVVNQPQVAKVMGPVVLCETMKTYSPIAPGAPPRLPPLHPLLSCSPAPSSPSRRQARGREAQGGGQAQGAQEG